MLAEFDETLDVFGGSPPPVVFASLFDGVLPSGYPSELGGLPVQDVRERTQWRSVYYSETMGVSEAYDLSVEVGSYGLYETLARVEGPLKSVGFASCIPDDTLCAVAADDGVITLSYAGDGVTQEQVVEELRKAVEYYAND